MINKYVIIKGHPILFPSEIIHSDMISNPVEVEGAGFFLIMKDRKNQKPKVVCMGESTSLHVHSRLEIDEKIIAGFLGLEV